MFYKMSEKVLSLILPKDPNNSLNFRSENPKPSKPINPSYISTKSSSEQNKSSLKKQDSRRISIKYYLTSVIIPFIIWMLLTSDSNDISGHDAFFNDLIPGEVYLIIGQSTTEMITTQGVRVLGC